MVKIKEKQKVKFEIVKIVVRTNLFEEANKKTRIHVFTQGENVVDDILNRHNRPYKLYKEFIPQVLEEAGINKDEKISWSQYAGCKCPCSPGFILPNHKGMTIFVDVKMSIGE